MFDSLTEKVQSESYILNDLLLEINHTEFRIDSSMIIQSKLFIFEIKNLESEHLYDIDHDKFIRLPKIEISNPLHQISRKEILLRKFLEIHNLYIPIESYVIFVNPEFTLYKAPINPTIILQTQLNQFMKRLDNSPSKLGVIHRKLAETLVAAHKEKSSRQMEFKYKYDEVKKGFTCFKCDSLDTKIEGNKLKCHVCDYEELIEKAVLRCVEEIKVLFPEKRITTSLVREWCNFAISIKVIFRILNRNLRVKGSGRWVYFE